MKIVLDRPRCEGHGLCEEAAPALLHLDEDDELVIDREDVGDDDLAAANAAVRVYPWRPPAADRRRRQRDRGADRGGHAARRGVRR